MTLTRFTQAMLKYLEHGLPGPLLDVGSCQGAVADRAGCAYVHVNLIACEAAGSQGVSPILHADLLPEGPFATILFDAREYEPGLAAETVIQAAQRLNPTGLLVTSARPADVARAFTELQSHGDLVLARRPKPDAQPAGVYTYDLECQDRHYAVASAAGLFSPGALDTGTALMLAAIAREERLPGPLSFLDLGCGTGVVSMIATRAWQCRVTAADVDARALRLTAMNAPEAEVIATDGFSSLGDRRFDIIATNPPYHTDFAVASGFIEGAEHHLAPGGTLYLVVKRAEWYRNKLRQVFGGSRAFQEYGYTVFAAEKREQLARPPQRPQPTTRKHARRLKRAEKG